jgi:hypothetical protein
LRFAFYRLACDEDAAIDGLTRVRTLAVGLGAQRLARRATIFTVDDVP